MGVVLFGQRRVSAKVHFFAVLMVALGLTLTLFWVVVLHTWAQAPVGAAPIDGRYQVYEWSEVILTPFVLWRSLGFVAGAFLFAGFLLLSVTAWQALRRPLDAGEHLSFRAGVLVSLCALCFIGLHLMAMREWWRAINRLSPPRRWATGIARPHLSGSGWVRPTSKPARLRFFWPLT